MSGTAVHMRYELLPRSRSAAFERYTRYSIRVMPNQTIDQDLVNSRISQAAAAANASVFAHALDIDSRQEVGFNSDAPVVTASVFKVPVLVEYVRQVAAGELEPTTRLQLHPSNATLGPTGLSVFSDPTEWSLRDMATSMITVSDNAATDVITALVGVDRVNATMEGLGLPQTKLAGDCAAIFASMLEDVGATDFGDPKMQFTVADSERVARLAACTPERTNRSTPRESSKLLNLIWKDQAANAEACAEARRILGLQVWSHRLKTGFPSDDIKVSGKTGTIGVVRNEIGVVEFPDGRRHAISVFIRTNEYRMRNPDADLLIGTVGRILSDQLG